MTNAPRAWVSGGRRSRLAGAAKLVFACLIVFATCGPSVDAQEDSSPATFFRVDRERMAQQRRASPSSVVQRPTRMIRRAAPVRGYARVVPETNHHPRFQTPRLRDDAPHDPALEEAISPADPAAPGVTAAPPPVADAAPPLRPAPPRAADPAFTIVVLGDSLGQMLGQGLAEAFAEKPEVSVQRRARENSGLVREDYFDWLRAARDIAGAADRPNLAVIMVGSNDRQVFREAGAPVELRSARWQQLYGERVEAITRIFNDRKIPLVWVGLPIMKNDRFSADMAAFNEIFKERASRAGTTFIDAWEPFLDDRGLYAAYGPDVNGQFQKLRAGDGVHFTRAGARKLAFFLEAEIRRAMDGARPKVDLEVAALAAQQAPAAPLQPGVPPPPARGASDPLIVVPLPPAAPQVVIPVRPAEGAVVALTAPVISPGGQLVARARPSAAGGDAQQLIDRVLVQGRPPEARPGRADDFAWPRR